MIQIPVTIQNTYKIHPVWPDDGITISTISPKVVQKFKKRHFTKSPKTPDIWASFVRKCVNYYIQK